jgi:cellulose 1,4-beta-cellobiosidase
MGLQFLANTGSVTFGWTPVAGATGYTIWRGLLTSGTFSTSFSVGASPTPVFTDVSVVPGTTYFYVVITSTGAYCSPKQPVTVQ